MTPLIEGSNQPFDAEAGADDDGSEPAPVIDAASTMTRRAKQPTKTTTQPVKPPRHKYSTLPKFGFVVQTKHPGPRQGADRDRHEPRAGVRWTRRRRARSALQGGFGCEQWPSCLRHGADSVFAWLRARAHASTRSDMRGRARTVKSCGPDARGLCVKPCGDVAIQPDTRISHPRAGRGQ